MSARIEAVLARVERRLRLQRVADWATAAIVPASAAYLAILWLWRTGRLADRRALVAGAVALSAIPLFAIGGALRRWSRVVLANRLDRASGLADRIGTAHDFIGQLSNAPSGHHADTLHLMRAAIADADRALGRADVAAAAPLSAPRDTRAALAFALAAVAVTCLGFGPARSGGSIGVRRPTGAAPNPASARPIDPDDVDYSRDLVADMKEVAATMGDKELAELARSLDALLDKAAAGAISKAELLAELDKLERRAAEGIEDNERSLTEGLAEMGRALQHDAATRELGKALAEGDLATAEKELERLAAKVEKEDLAPTERKKLADALEQAARKLGERQNAENERAARALARQEDEVRRLERKHAEQPKDEETERRLARERRSLDRLERRRNESKEQAQERQLDRLTRDLGTSAESLRLHKPEAARALRDAAEDTRKVEDEIRKIQNRRRSQSQLAELKEALRRARAGESQGGSRAQRLRDFQRRASGGRAKAEAFGRGARGAGSDAQGGDKGSGAGQEGSQLGGKEPGTGHDPNVLGDPTGHTGKTKDAEVSGIEGHGPSRRETIVTAAQKGFAQRAYRQVYAEYQKIVEEVIQHEKVPQGYKYYVKRYFQRIKPHAMDD